MSVYVDDAFIQASVPNGSATHSSKWCHLTADTPEELHAFAARLGLKRSYFQPGKPIGGKPSPFWHYDLTESKRARAIALGARAVPYRELPEICRAREAARQAREAEPVTGRLLISGSRSWTDYDTIRRELAARYRPGMVLVSGANPQGADAMCEQVWRDLGGRVERHPADWDRYGTGAGSKRNDHMIGLGAEECVAFQAGKTPGTSHCSSQAAKAEIKVSVCHPSSADFDYRAGLAWKAGNLEKAKEIIRQAADLYPHSPERERWSGREERIRREIEKRTGQASLFQMEAQS
jgi:hypothetical protein